MAAAAGGSSGRQQRAARIEEEATDGRECGWQASVVGRSPPMADAGDAGGHVGRKWRLHALRSPYIAHVCPSVKSINGHFYLITYLAQSWL